jgi:ribonucleoside-diphosphate reductase alpha chain
VIYSAMWTSDLFMKRVQENGKVDVNVSSECPRLYDVYGEEFEKVYYSYEEAGKGKKKVRRSCGRKILESQIETGTPYMLYKDAVNRSQIKKI